MEGRGMLPPLPRPVHRRAEEGGCSACGAGWVQCTVVQRKVCYAPGSAASKWCPSDRLSPEHLTSPTQHVEGWTFRHPTCETSTLKAGPHRARSRSRCVATLMLLVYISMGVATPNVFLHPVVLNRKSASRHHDALGVARPLVSVMAECPNHPSRHATQGGGGGGGGVVRFDNNNDHTYVTPLGRFDLQ